MFFVTGVEIGDSTNEYNVHVVLIICVAHNIIFDETYLSYGVLKICLKASWFVGNRQIHNDTGMPLFHDWTKTRLKNVHTSRKTFDGALFLESGTKTKNRRSIPPDHHKNSSYRILAKKMIKFKILNIQKRIIPFITCNCFYIVNRLLDS